MHILTHNKYQIKKSWELLEKADSCVYDNDLNEALLALYQSCYIIARTLLTQCNINSIDHEEVKTLFHKTFTQSNRFSSHTERIYSRLYVYRREINNNETEFTDSVKIKEYQSRTQDFLKEAAQLLTSL